jgi:hypothetical protein
MKFASHSFIRLGLFLALLVALACAMVLWTLRWDRTVTAYSECFRGIGGLEVAASESAGRIFMDNDAYYWVAYAREMAETGTWRIRHTTLDNPPEGRPVHWSQSVTWLLLLAGGIRHGWTGEGMSVAIEQAAIWVGPGLLILLMAGAGGLIYRRLGLVPAMLWVLNIATMASISWAFHPLRPDHHGLHLGFVVSGVLCLVLGGMGWVQEEHGAAEEADAGWFRPTVPPNRREARWLFGVSGVLGGLGLWTGASVQLLGLGLVAIGAGLSVCMVPKRDSSAAGMEYDADLWRVWGWVAAITAVCFYLVEYAPRFPGMRLEMNHPLYALSWVCIGGFLARWSAARREGRRISLRWAVPLAVGAVLVPALLVLGPPEWHAMRNPLMQRMHHYIDEFRPYAAIYSDAFWPNLLRDFGVVLLFMAVAVWLVRRKGISPSERAALVMALVVAMGYAALTLWWQARWMNFFGACGLLATTVVLSVFWSRQRRNHLMGVWFLLLVLAGQSAYSVHWHFQDISRRDISRVRIGELIVPMLQRQFAEKLAALDEDGAFRVMGGPHMAARLHYYGGIPNVASYYWENLDGLKAASDFFGSTDDQEALSIARERGITHVVLPPSASLIGMFHYVKTGNMSEVGARASLGGRMLERPETLPTWLRRDRRLERELQPGYLFHGEPIFGALQVYVVENIRLSGGADVF